MDRASLSNFKRALPEASKAAQGKARQGKARKSPLRVIVPPMFGCNHATPTIIRVVNESVDNCPAVWKKQLAIDRAHDDSYTPIQTPTPSKVLSVSISS